MLVTYHNVPNMLPVYDEDDRVFVEVFERLDEYYAIDITEPRQSQIVTFGINFIIHVYSKHIEVQYGEAELWYKGEYCHSTTIIGSFVIMLKVSQANGWITYRLIQVAYHVQLSTYVMIPEEYEVDNKINMIADETGVTCYFTTGHYYTRDWSGWS